MIPNGNTAHAKPENRGDGTVSQRHSLTVKVRCPLCELVEVQASVVPVYVSRQDHSRDHYEFTCPRCKDRVVKPADEAIIRQLVNKAGAPLHVIPIEAEEPHSGDTISWDDVLDFHNAIDSDDAIAELLDSR